MVGKDNKFGNHSSQIPRTKRKTILDFMTCMYIHTYIYVYVIMLYIFYVQLNTWKIESGTQNTCLFIIRNYTK